MKVVFFFFILCCTTSCMRLCVPVESYTHPACPEGAPAQECVAIDEILSQELTADLAVSLALLNNPSLRAVYNRLGIARADLWQAGLLPNPIFSLAYRFATRSGFGPIVDIGVLESFLEIFLIPLKRNMARAELEMTRQLITNKILEIEAETRLAFLSLQERSQMLHFKEEMLMAREASYDAASRIFEAGNMKVLELTRQRILYEQAQVAATHASVEVLEAKERLNRVMGLWGCQIQWSFDPCLPCVPPGEECWEDIEVSAIANSLDLAISKAKLLSSSFGLRMGVIRQVLPNVDIGVAAEYEEIWFVGPAFSSAIPLFDFGKAKTVAAQAEICRQWNMITDLAIDIRSAARTAQFHLLNVHAQALYYADSIVPLAEKLTYETLLQANAMQLGVIPLLATKMEEIERKMEALELQQKYWMFRIQIEMLSRGHLMKESVMN